MTDRYDYLLFDIDNTLLDFSRSEAESLEKALLTHGYSAFDPKIHIPVYREVNREIWAAYEKGLISSEELRIERYRQYLEKIDCTADPSAVSADYISFLSQSAHVYDGVEDMLECISGNVPMAIVTNGLESVQKPRLHLSGLTRFFDTVIISDEVGAAKPAPEIFTIARNELGVSDGQKGMIIGDNLYSDILGGINTGIDTCWYNPCHHPRDKEITPLYEVHSIGEMSRLFGC